MIRISNTMLFDRALSAMLNQQGKVAETQLQVANGKRVLSPEDDPAAAAYVMGIRGSMASVEQYQRNGELAKQRLNLEETTLASVTNQMQRVVELAIRGQNDAYDGVNRGAIAAEIREIHDTLLGLANTQDANGEYIFAGFASDAPPFVSSAPGSYSYNGDQGQRQVQIATDRGVADRDSGFDLFMDVPTAAGGIRNVFQTLHEMATALEANTPDAAYLDDVHSFIGTLLEVRTKVGARVNAIDEQREIHEDFLLTLDTTRSEEEDLDYAEAISRFQRQMTALQAAQQAFTKVQGLSLFNYLS